jgi:hypothetical protein
MAHFTKHLPATHSGHREVEENKVGLMLAILKQYQRAFSATCGFDLNAFDSEEQSEQAAYRWVIVDYESSRHGGSNPWCRMAD